MIPKLYFQVFQGTFLKCAQRDIYEDIHCKIVCTWPASWEICMQVRKQQLELDMEQQTGSK